MNSRERAQEVLTRLQELRREMGIRWLEIGLLLREAKQYAYIRQWQGYLTLDEFVEKTFGFTARTGRALVGYSRDTCTCRMRHVRGLRLYPKNTERRTVLRSFLGADVKWTIELLGLSCLAVICWIWLSYKRATEAEGRGSC
jgi:hypothetical protein